MLFQAEKNQTSYGEAIGILLLDSGAPFIQGDVGNATTYDFPVRFKRIDGLTVFCSIQVRRLFRAMSATPQPMIFRSDLSGLMALQSREFLRTTSRLSKKWSRVLESWSVKGSRR